MSFVRAIKKPYGTYYARVEGYRDKDGKVRQRVIKYLGKSPNTMELPVDPKIAGQLAQALMSNKTQPSELKTTLETLGIHLGPGKINKISLIYNPPQRKLTLRIE